MRPYYNYDDQQPGRAQVSFSAGWTSTVKALIVANGLAFLAVLALQRSYPDIYQWVGFHLPNFLRGAYWQPVSYMFVHGGLWHLFCNMLGLFFFAGDVERALGRWPFLLMYFLCGIGGAALSLFQPQATVIGASGGVLGVLIAYAVLFPDARIWLFLVIPVRARYVAVLYAFVTAAGLLSEGTDGTAYWAHLGGIVVAFAFVKAMPAARWLARLRLARPEASPQVRRSGTEQAELDRILEKVHREGITALSNGERDFLNLMSRKGR